MGWNHQLVNHYKPVLVKLDMAQVKKTRLSWWRCPGDGKPGGVKLSTSKLRHTDAYCTLSLKPSISNLIASAGDLNTLSFPFILHSYTVGHDLSISNSVFTLTWRSFSPNCPFQDLVQCERFGATCRSTKKFLSTANMFVCPTRKKQLYRYTKYMHESFETTLKWA